MLKQLLKVGFPVQCRKAFLARQTNLYSVSCKSIRNASSGKYDNDDDFDKPIKYSESKASTWRAIHSRNPLIDRHPHESTIVSISLVVFLFYFLVYREENDIDLLLSADYMSQIPGLAKQPALTSNSK